MILSIISLGGSAFINTYIKYPKQIKKLLPLEQKLAIEKRNLIKEMDFQSKVNKYNEQNAKYLNSVEVYAKKYKHDYILSKYVDILKPRTLPIRSEKSVRKGKTEDFFLSYLLRYFPSEIKINLLLGSQESAFYPDFIFESKDVNFLIDIEIDERYSMESKQPIHYIGSGDEIRNEYFLDFNWFIIRFAEEQILNSPDHCCLFIQEIISIIKNPHLYEKGFKTYLQRIKRWTFEESYLDGLGNKRKDFS